MPSLAIARLDHIGITVPDLDQARAFFEDVLGFEYLYRLGPLRGEGTWMSEHLNIDDDAIAPRIYFFRVGEQAMLEVFEYQAPNQRRDVPLNSDIGGHHLASTSMTSTQRLPSCAAAAYVCSVIQRRVAVRTKASAGCISSPPGA